MSTIPIKYLKKNKTLQKYYPRTSGEAVTLEDGNNLEQELALYKKTEDLVNDLNFTVSGNNLELRLGDTLVASLNKTLLVNIVHSTQFNSETGDLSIVFSNGDVVEINLTNLVGDILEETQGQIEELQNQHVIMSEEQYETLEEIDPNKFYYLYEDE